MINVDVSNGERMFSYQSVLASRMNNYPHSIWNFAKEAFSVSDIVNPCEQCVKQEVKFSIKLNSPLKSLCQKRQTMDGYSCRSKK